MDALEWRPTATLKALQARAGLNQQVRDFFKQRGVLEVETPALSQAGNTDPAIDSFQVTAKQARRYLHTSPEYPMKRLLAAGSGDIYQLCKVWRDDERGRKHNPEFSLLEYYRVGFSYQRLMQEVAELLHNLLPQLSATPNYLSYRDSFKRCLGIDPWQTDANSLAALAEQRGLAVHGELDQQQWCDLLFTQCIEPQFVSDRLTFIYHYPAAQAALAQVINSDGFAIAERFEVYCGAMELGNGYQEQTDAQQNRNTLIQGLLTNPRDIPYDERFLAALTEGHLPACAGVALGIDRILMCRLQEKALAPVISFAWELA